MPALSWIALCACAVLTAAEPAVDEVTRPGVHTAGRWTYTLTVTNAGTRSEGRVGVLAFDGVDLPAPPERGAYTTPWGLIGWVGTRTQPWGAHRWMPVGAEKAAAAVALPDPARTATARVRLAHVVQRQPEGAAETPPAWLTAGLGELGITEPCALTVWAEVAAQPVTLHDSRHYGQAAIALLPPAADATELVLAVDGADRPADAPAQDVIRLPRRHGTHQVCRRALTSQFGTIDVLFALEAVVDLALPAEAIGPPPTGGLDSLVPPFPTSP